MKVTHSSETLVWHILAMHERSSILYTIFSRWLLLFCVFFWPVVTGNNNSTAVWSVPLQRLQCREYKSVYILLIYSEMSKFKTHEKIYSYVMCDFFMMSHFLEMLWSWTGALCKVMTDWHPLKLNLSDCFWCKLLSTKLHWAL